MFKKRNSLMTHLAGTLTLGIGIATCLPLRAEDDSADAVVQSGQTQVYTIRAADGMPRQFTVNNAAQAHELMVQLQAAQQTAASVPDEVNSMLESREQRLQAGIGNVLQGKEQIEQLRHDAAVDSATGQILSVAPMAKAASKAFLGAVQATNIPEASQVAGTALDAISFTDATQNPVTGATGAGIADAAQKAGANVNAAKAVLGVAETVNALHEGKTADAAISGVDALGNAASAVGGKLGPVGNAASGIANVAAGAKEFSETVSEDLDASKRQDELNESVAKMQEQNDARINHLQDLASNVHDVNQFLGLGASSDLDRVMSQLQKDYPDAVPVTPDELHAATNDAKEDVSRVVNAERPDLARQLNDSQTLPDDSQNSPEPSTASGISQTDPNNDEPNREELPSADPRQDESSVQSANSTANDGSGAATDANIPGQDDNSWTPAREQTNSDSPSTTSSADPVWNDGSQTPSLDTTDLESVNDASTIDPSQGDDSQSLAVDPTSFDPNGSDSVGLEDINSDNGVNMQVDDTSNDPGSITNGSEDDGNNNFDQGNYDQGIDPGSDDSGSYDSSGDDQGSYDSGNYDSGN